MNQTDAPDLRLPLSRIRRPGLIVGLVGLLLAVGGALFDLEQFWRSYLLAYVFWLEISLGCLGLVMLHHVAGGRWGFVIRRLMESGAMLLALLALLFIPLLFGLTRLYSWTDPDFMARSELLQHKGLYLNLPFFLIRTVIYFSVWTGLAYLLNRWSLQQDQTGAPELTTRLRRLSSLGLILYFVTATFAAYDWMMSLEPEWFSSIYGLLFIVGQVLAALALAIIGLRLMSRDQPLTDRIAGAAWRKHFGDLGNLMLGFVLVWAYIAFSQFLIIWSANLPEEAVWYYHRTRGGWQGVGLFLILFHFGLPFFLLLSRRVRHQAQLLAALALMMLLMRLVDLYWLIVPAFFPNEIHLHWLDLALLVAIGGGWMALFARQLARKPLVPLYNAYLEETHRLHRADEVG